MSEKKTERQQVFDPLRGKYVALTPEEAVRQSFIKFLIEKRAWPKTLLMSETEIKLGEVRQRCDIVGYGKSLTPKLIVECKAQSVKITASVFEQIWRYALILKVRWLVVTNGVSTYACEYSDEEGKYKYIADIPYFTED